MKLFISQPMAGKTIDEIREERKKAYHDACRILGRKAHLIKPLVKMSSKNAINGNAPLRFFAQSIHRMVHADVVYFAEGWQNARGCRLEYRIAAAEYRL